MRSVKRFGTKVATAALAAAMVPVVATGTAYGAEVRTRARVTAATGTGAELRDELTQAPKVVFSSSLEEPLMWANCTLVRGDAVDAVRALKESGSGILSTIGSLSLCRSLLTPASSTASGSECSR